MNKEILYSVFTKPWKDQTVDELGTMLMEMGVDGIEFPLREGYQVDLAQMEQGLVQLVRQLKDHGISVFSAASSTDERVFSACAQAGVPMIRIMAAVDKGKGYMEWEKEMKQRLEKTLKLCEKYQVQVGIQHHFGMMVSNAMELYHLIEDFDPRYIGAVWDAGHSGLAGDEMEKGLDILWSHLCMVNFKNAFYRRANGPDAHEARWDRYFTLGSQGLASWPRAVQYLKERNYQGVVCLTAEYSQEDRVNEFIRQDVEYIKSLFGGC